MKALNQLFSAAISSLLIVGTTFPVGSLAAASCREDSTTMSKVELYFGMDIPDGGQVDAEAWQTFIDNVVTPRFPDGLTIDQVSGQWRDAATGQTIQESSRVLMILYAPSPDAEQAIEEIRAAYKTQFQQDSVMRLDEANCVSF